jgi:hypothetical protein
LAVKTPSELWVLVIAEGLSAGIAVSSERIHFSPEERAQGAEREGPFRDWSRGPNGETRGIMGFRQVSHLRVRRR